MDLSENFNKSFEDTLPNIEDNYNEQQTLKLRRFCFNHIARLLSNNVSYFFFFKISENN